MEAGEANNASPLLARDVLSSSLSLAAAGAGADTATLELRRKSGTAGGIAVSVTICWPFDVEVELARRLPVVLESEEKDGRRPNEGRRSGFLAVALGVAGTGTAGGSVVGAIPPELVFGRPGLVLGRDLLPVVLLPLLLEDADVDRKSVV